MKTALAVLFLSASAFAQVNVWEPAVMFRKVDPELDSRTTKVYIKGELSQDVREEYSEGDLVAVVISTPFEATYTFRHKYNEKGDRVLERSQYDPGGQVQKIWKYEWADDESCVVTETGENDSVIWRYNAVGKLLTAEYRDVDDVLYKKLVNSYDGADRLTLSEELNVKDGKEALTKKMWLSYKSADTRNFFRIKTYRGDGTLSFVHNYDDRGDLTDLTMYNVHEEAIVYVSATSEYKDNGHGEEKISETIKVYQGGSEKMSSRAEYERIYNEK